MLEEWGRMVAQTMWRSRAPFRWVEAPECLLLCLLLCWLLCWLLCCQKLGMLARVGAGGRGLVPPHLRPLLPSSRVEDQMGTESWVVAYSTAADIFPPLFFQTLEHEALPPHRLPRPRSMGRRRSVPKTHSPMDPRGRICPLFVALRPVAGEV